MILHLVYSLSSLLLIDSPVPIFLPTDTSLHLFALFPKVPVLPTIILFSVHHVLIFCITLNLFSPGVFTITISDDKTDAYAKHIISTIECAVNSYCRFKFVADMAHVFNLVN